MLEKKNADFSDMDNIWDHFYIYGIGSDMFFQGFTALGSINKTIGIRALMLRTAYDKENETLYMLMYSGYPPLNKLFQKYYLIAFDFKTNDMKFTKELTGYKEGKHAWSNMYYDGKGNLIFDLQNKVKKSTTSHLCVYNVLQASNDLN